MPKPQAKPTLVLGRLGAPHGVRGWIRVTSYTEPPEGLLDYQPWRLRFADGRTMEARVREAEGSGTRWRVALEGVGDRSAAERLTGCLIEAERTALKELPAREYYRDELIGFAVVNRDGVRLGTVQGFLDAPANPVMVVGGERERWLPAMPPCLVRVRRADREIDVDWPAEL